MSTPLTFCRRLTARLAPVLALAGVVALALGALHHMEPNRAHAPCAVCILASTPAIGSTAVAVPRAPMAWVERRLPPAVAPPRSNAVSASHSRAPPSA